ncbi:uroporphyrinogen-III C-methyltransferase [Melaminivora sp.]|uniref:uroporphyrinogen-III C-methyltransferase n=1 Tax=Melaminivora sp. TaxID=1933032 RepID=UPI0028ACAB3A|nr:uroporphyrinogen-III C-methyltransferase [Melaminivora sp.]
MPTEPIPEPNAVPAAQPLPPAPATGRVALVVVGLVAAAALASSVLLWQRLSAIQEQLARQSADSGAQAIEARTMAREAQETTREASARLALMEARVGEVALQRSQLEELMHSLSRTRDENLVVDIEASLRLAQQQSQLTGSLQPLVAALRSADQRIERAAQPRLVPVQRAIEQDLERLARASVTDTAGLLGRLDDLVRQVDELPLSSAVGQGSGLHRAADGRDTAPGQGGAQTAPPQAEPAWRAALRQGWTGLREEVRGLVRVSRIDQPDAMLIAPDQAFFLRENLKLKLLNARLALLARRMDSARADLQLASASLGKYFDPASRRTQGAMNALQQLQGHIQTAGTPQLEDTFAALSTAAAGR